mgnify:FL=1
MLLLLLLLLLLCMLACYRGARRSIGIAFTEKVLLVGVLAGRQFLRRPTRSTTLLESLILYIYLTRDGGESSRLDSTNARARARDGCGEEKRANNRGKSAWLVRFTFSSRAETFSTAGAVSRFIRSLAIANVSTLAHSHTLAHTLERGTLVVRVVQSLLLLLSSSSSPFTIQSIAS